MDFKSVPVGRTPGGWVNAAGKFSVIEVGKEKMLFKRNDAPSPLVARANAFIDTPDATDYTIHYNVAQSYLLNDGIRIRPHPHRSYPQMPADLFPGSTATGVTTLRATTPGTVFKFVTRFSSDDIKVGNVGVTTPIIWTWTF
jgi:hypothetical protein